MCVQTAEPLLRLCAVHKEFVPRGTGFARLWTRPGVPAVEGLSLHVSERETYGLVGESGSGKTTTGRIAVGLLKPDSGEVLFRPPGAERLSPLEGVNENLQMVFQDPYSSLNPRMRIGKALEEPLVIHTRQGAAARRKAVGEILNQVGLSREDALRFPHEFSGGQRQRIGLARALILGPRLIVCDEPVSALDVSIQAQILTLLQRVREELGLSLLFISHDLRVVRYVSDRIGVMYMGRMVEEAEADTLFEVPRHPYTRTLLSALPEIRHTPGGERNIPGPARADAAARPDPRLCCPFHPRCPQSLERCRTEVPPLRDVAAGHRLACFLE